MNNSREKTRNIRNISLPLWTKDDIAYDVKIETKGVPNLEQNTEQIAEPPVLHHHASWVSVVKAWTPEMVAKAWPVIDRLIRENGESQASQWVCDESEKFFDFDLTSNPKKHTMPV